MTPDLWRRLKPLFYAALEKHEKDRTSFIDDACGNDWELKLNLQRLLKANISTTLVLGPVLAESSQEDIPIPALPNIEGGMHIGKYKILCLLGVGGMGMVFQATDEDGGLFALKMIGSTSDIQATLSTKALLERHQPFDKKRRIGLVKEARIAMGLRHPNIVTVFDYGQHRGLLYIVMEYLQGQSLARLMRSEDTMPLTSRLNFLIKVCEALEYAHAHGVIHRDVKPENVFVCTDGSVKVLDFGISVRASETTKQGKALVGTIAYMAPEVITTATSSDARADVWSLGIMLFQLLTGETPFYSSRVSECLRKIISAAIPVLDQEIPCRLHFTKLLESALAKDPLQRLSSAGQFAGEVQRVMQLLKAVAIHRIGPELVLTEVPLIASLKRPFAGKPPASSLPDASVQVRIGEIAANKTVQKLTSVNRLQLVIGITQLLSPGILLGGMISGEREIAIVFLALPLLGIMFLQAARVVVAIAAKIAEYPCCAQCRRHMVARHQVTRFASNKMEVDYSLSDCVAALEENLWEDATKLFELHSRESINFSANVLTSPPIRYHLNFFHCPWCDHNCGRVFSENRVEDFWVMQDQYSEAYRGNFAPRIKPSLLNIVANYLSLLGNSINGAFDRAAIDSRHAVWLVGFMFVLFLVWDSIHHAVR